MEKRPLRVGAVIVTTEGVVTVSDSKDKRRDYYLDKIKRREEGAGSRKRKQLLQRLGLAKQLVQFGRQSLPGGKIEPADYEEAKATSLLDIENPTTPEQIEQFLTVMRYTIAREVDEELGLGIDMDHIEKIMEIKGRVRDHIIFIVHAQGIIKPNLEEISGIALLTDKLPSIPLNELFCQSHVRTFWNRFFHDPRHHALMKDFLSKVSVSKEMVDDIYRRQMLGYAYSGGKSASPKRQEPYTLHSSPNFQIYDGDERYNPGRAPIFTKASSAKLVPAEMELSSVPPSTGSKKKPETPPLAKTSTGSLKHMDLPTLKAGDSPDSIASAAATAAKPIIIDGLRKTHPPQTLTRLPKATSK